MPETHTVIDLLKQVELFRDTPDPVLDELCDCVKRLHYKPGQRIITKGDEGDTLFIIGVGCVKVHDGDEVVATLNQGNFFGEISLLDSAPRSMSVTAVNEAELYTLCSEDFYRVFKNQPQVTKIVISTLTRRLRRQNEVNIQHLRNREAELTQLVDERTAELKLKNKALSEAMDEVKSTQEQLIQQEKLASLGALTAGIAHEIQNPLNFVTNFSKLSVELLTEMEASNSEEERKEISHDLKLNLERINHHGKRADGIVKGMLQHSRSATGEKHLTDINQLCEEYINLAYHGMRATKEPFNLEIKKEFDASVPKLMIVPQDLSRVVLNLVNNSFYAVNDKRKAKEKSGESGYEPEVSLKTYRQNGSVVISVRDNGSGIPDNIREKIFEPFFTTKPTGQGTGLGLSLSYDIIKSYGGNMKVESEKGKFTEFTISLPTG